DARPATQVPFLRVALRTYKEKVKDADSFASIEIGLLMSIIKGTKSVAADALDNWIAAAVDIGVDSKVLQGLEDNSVKNYYGNLEIRSKTNTDIRILVDGQITSEGKQELKINDI